MMISDLPQDLLEEILCRVPATSVKRVRSICKRWRALFNDQRFTAKHFHKEPKESMVLLLTKDNVMPMRVNLNATSPSIEFKGVLSLRNSVKADIKSVFHCDGLLLCRNKDLSLMVWNLCLGEPISIKFDTGTDRYSWFALGYEKNASCHSYKIVMIPSKALDCKFKIYEFSSDSWRVLDDVVLKDCQLSTTGVPLKGNIYWLAYDKEDKSQFLLSFDFTLERFKRLSLPEDNGEKMALSVVGDKQLLLLSESYAVGIRKMDIWVTNEIDSDIETEFKWSKSFTFDSDCCICLPVLVNYLNEEKKKVAVHCLGKGMIHHVHVIGEKNESYIICENHSLQRSWPLLIINYVPSLVQVQKCFISKKS